MPTSAGKTKATEIIVRSAFLSTRTSLAIIVAPFRALCNEISTDLKTKFYNEEISVNEMTDVFQMDFEIADIIRRKQILVVTPENFIYFKELSELSNEIGLIIYDEGTNLIMALEGLRMNCF
ncbi:DEAD/DEAH box helicase [Staphylococcus xylosus]|uniref:DEAD/DEAH box helicase n=1 Tax=Staphylococcus xylosus TaxID=1288 RepID=A0A939SM99_STAXY|nr:DEAD/DEAH box helicase [Staphylococcus xylosus]